jgi:hypothetical protein
VLAFIRRELLRLYRHDFREQTFPEKHTRALLTFYTFNYILDRPESFLWHLCRSMTEHELMIMGLFARKGWRSRRQSGLGGLPHKQTNPSCGWQRTPMQLPHDRCSRWGIPVCAAVHPPRQRGNRGWHAARFSARRTAIRTFVLAEQKQGYRLQKFSVQDLLFAQTQRPLPPRSSQV